MAVQWYYLDGENRLGPLTGARLKELADKGVIVPWTPVMRVANGKRTAWMKAGVLEALYANSQLHLLGDPICEKCGARLADGRCTRCDPPPPPPVVEETTPDEVSDASPATDETTQPPITSRHSSLQKSAELIKLGAYIGHLLGLFVAFCAAANGIYQLVTGRNVVMFAISLVASVIVYGLTELAYLLTKILAGTIEVLIDIEENTRSTTANTHPSQVDADTPSV